MMVGLVCLVWSGCGKSNLINYRQIRLLKGEVSLQTEMKRKSPLQLQALLKFYAGLLLSHELSSTCLFDILGFFLYCFYYFELIIVFNS